MAEENEAELPSSLLMPIRPRSGCDIWGAAAEKGRGSEKSESEQSEFQKQKGIEKEKRK